MLMVIKCGTLRSIYSREEMVMTRLRMLFVLLLGGLLAGSGFFAGAAGADPYPPGGCFPLTITTTVPVAGQTVTIGGRDFLPGDTVRLKLVPPGTVLGTVIVGADGNFSVDVTIPADAAPGEAQIEDIADHPLCPMDPINIKIGGAKSGSGGGSGLAFTGVQILSALALAVALLVAGIAFTISGRRRRAHGAS
jgi:hypothetical protein